jgi:hypothetical protein
MKSVRGSKLVVGTEYVMRIWRGNGDYSFRNMLFRGTDAVGNLKSMADGSVFHFEDAELGIEQDVFLIDGSLRITGLLKAGYFRVTFALADVAAAASPAEAPTEEAVARHVNEDEFAAEAPVAATTHDETATAQYMNDVELAAEAPESSAEEPIEEAVAQHVNEDELAVEAPVAEETAGAVEESKEDRKRRLDRERKAAKRAALKELAA